MRSSTNVALKPGLTLDAEQSALLFADIDAILGFTEADTRKKSFFIWQRIQDWTGHAASGQPLVPLSERLEAIRKEEYPDESSKARLIRAIVFQALERNLDSDSRQGSFSATLSLIGDITRLGWGWGSITLSELGERSVPVASLSPIEMDEISIATEEELSKRFQRFLQDDTWLKNGAVAGSVILVLYSALFDLFVRAVAVQADRKAANREDLTRALDALDRTVGPNCERLVKLSGHGLAAMLLDNLMQRPAIVASMSQFGRN